MQAQRVEVDVHGSPFSLAAPDSAIPLYTATVTVSQPGAVPYRYVVDGKPEVFLQFSLAVVPRGSAYFADISPSEFHAVTSGVGYHDIQ